MIDTKTQQYSVLIVDDSIFMRKLIAEMISADPAFTVAGFAWNGVDAVQQVNQLHPDLVTLDLEMPKLDGLQALEQIMTQSPRPVIILSASGPQFGDATMRALELGAVDFIKKPSGVISLDLSSVQERLLGALRVAITVDIAKVRPIGSPLRGMITSGGDRQGTAQCAGRSERPAVLARRVVVIASSTGGPRALAEIVPALPQNLRAAVLIAQHMPKEFTHSLAQRLNQTSVIQVSEGVDNEPLLEGRVYIAPGRTHMRVAGTLGAPTIAIDVDRVVSGVCPSADELFISATHFFGANVIGVVLTGMGCDGAAGARVVRAEGGYLLVQDRETSIINGMPQAALASAGADRVVALGDMAAAIRQAVTRQAEVAVGKRNGA